MCTATSPVATAPPRISVVILTWNDTPALLERAVRSALGSEGVDAEVIVVDNGSTPAAEVVTGVTLVREPINLGVAAGRNLGAVQANAPFICFLDSDARLETDTLRQLVGVMGQDPEIALTAPVFSGQNPAASAGKAPTLGRKLLRMVGITDLYSGRTAFSDGRRDVDFAIGACQVLRRHAFDAVGGLDGTIFYGPEDVDFCLRLRRHGWRVVQVERASCEHPPRRRNRRLLSRSGRRHAVALLRHLWRHRGGVDGSYPAPP